MCTDLLVLRTEASRSLSEDVVPVPLEVCGDWCGWKARPAVTKFMLTSFSHRWNSATSHLRTAVGKTQTARELQYLVMNRSWRCSSSKSPDRGGSPGLTSTSTRSWILVRQNLTFRTTRCWWVSKSLRC